MKVLVRLGWLLPVLLGMAAAQQDPHFLAPRTSAIAHRSAFAHGYLHGYEEGFHTGNLDLQMGHAPIHRNLRKESEKTSGYRREFGVRELYDGGFGQGYRVGYADAAAGRSFRAVDEIQQMSAAPLPPIGDAGAFDSGIARGYHSGQAQGLADGRIRRAANTVTPACPLDAVRHPGFCSGYARSYRMGYADGFINVAGQAVQQASK
jgi:hypothetical protein